MHTVNVNFSSTTSASNQPLRGRRRTSPATRGSAGVSTDPFDWGVPALSFSTFQACATSTPSRRTDKRLTLAYSWTQPWKTRPAALRRRLPARSHRQPHRSECPRRFVFTGLYRPADRRSRLTGADFADFLLGLPQQAALQYGPGNVQLRGRSASLFLQDDWRRSAKLTLNLGVRYELIRRSPKRTASSSISTSIPTSRRPRRCRPARPGPSTGAFPAGTPAHRRQQLAPRLGAAYRLKPGTDPARRLRHQLQLRLVLDDRAPARRPAAVRRDRHTQLGTVPTPLTLVNAFATPANQTAEQLRRRQELCARPRADVERRPVEGPRRSRGSSAPATRATTRRQPRHRPRAEPRPVGGLRIPDVQPFLWQTSEGISVLNAGTFRLQRRMVKGIGGGVDLHARQVDGRRVERSAAAARSSRRTIRISRPSGRSRASTGAISSSANLSFELPFGPNKHWLHDGGFCGGRSAAGAARPTSPGSRARR